MFRLALLAFLLSLAAQAQAQKECTCLWQGPFTRVEGGTDLVAAVTITGERGNSIDLRIDRVLRGETHGAEARVWLNNGELCRPEPGTFPVQSQWVMALDLIDEEFAGRFNPNTPNISHGRIGDFSISSCGGFWLSRTDELVSGNLTGGPRWEMNPKMSPVLLDLIAAYVTGAIDAETLKEAGRVDPELQQLILDTRVFLRSQH
jgi:hypothetical protein